MPSRSPLSVAVVNDYEIVVAGLAAALAPFRDRVAVVEVEAGQPVRDEVDLVLFDTFGHVDDADDGLGVALPDLVAGRAKVVVFSWSAHRTVIERTLELGASAYLSKQLSGAELVAALERIHRGEAVGAARPTREALETSGWPGSDEGLTARESEVLALIVRGLSNQQVAERTYLSINSIKTYIRSAYRKMGVTTRAQAVIWGVEHGFRPDRGRVGSRD